MKTLLCNLILLLMLCISSACIAQTLRGKILAADTKQPIAGANVFLSNTSTGAVANDKGEFMLDHFPAGRFDLVVSCIGFETEVQTIQSNQIAAGITIYLKPKAKDLDEVIVRHYDKDGWNKWGAFFIKTLIGSSAYANDCVLKNKEVVKFVNNKKERTLEAFADDELVIHNPALGYILRYRLTKFEFNSATQLFFYQGYPFFEAMQARNSKQAKRWQQNRDDAYYGSIMHFMRSLFRNKLEEEGFEVKKLKKVPNKEWFRVKPLYDSTVKALRNEDGFFSVKRNDSLDYYNEVMRRPKSTDVLINKLLPGDSIAFAVDSTTAGLYFEDYLHITYTKKREPWEFLGQNRTRKPNFVNSRIYLPYNKGVAVLANGSYFSGIDLITQDYWAWWEKLGNMLPLYFKPVSSR